MSRLIERHPILWARLAAWWPDLYVSALVATAAAVAIIGRGKVLTGTGVGSLVPMWLAVAWAIVLLAASSIVICAVARRRYILAADASTVLALALALNGAVVVVAKGLSATLAGAVYVGLALMLLERARQLDAPIPPPPHDYQPRTHR